MGYIQKPRETTGAHKGRSTASICWRVAPVLPTFGKAGGGKRQTCAPVPWPKTHVVAGPDEQPPKTQLRRRQDMLRGGMLSSEWLMEIDIGIGGVG